MTRRRLIERAIEVLEEMKQTKREDTFAFLTAEVLAILLIIIEAPE